MSPSSLAVKHGIPRLEEVMTQSLKRTQICKMPLAKRRKDFGKPLSNELLNQNTSNACASALMMLSRKPGKSNHEWGPQVYGALIDLTQEYEVSDCTEA